LTKQLVGVAALGCTVLLSQVLGGLVVSKAAIALITVCRFGGGIMFPIEHGYVFSGLVNNAGRSEPAESIEGSVRMYEFEWSAGITKGFAHIEAISKEQANQRMANWIVSVFDGCEFKPTGKVFKPWLLSGN
jgi:hypothetical protein